MWSCRLSGSHKKGDLVRVAGLCSKLSVTDWGKLRSSLDITPGADFLASSILYRLPTENNSHGITTSFSSSVITLRSCELWIIDIRSADHQTLAYIGWEAIPEVWGLFRSGNPTTAANGSLSASMGNQVPDIRLQSQPRSLIKCPFAPRTMMSRRIHSHNAQDTEPKLEVNSSILQSFVRCLPRAMIPTAPYSQHWILIWSSSCPPLDFGKMTLCAIAMPRSFLNYSFLLLSPGLLAGITTASANCYYPNGTDRNSGLSNIQYAPINTGDNYSMCCAATDKPRSDGLCENQPGTIIYRESCTDQSWQSPKCIKLCAGSNNGKHKRLPVL